MRAGPEFTQRIVCEKWPPPPPPPPPEGVEAGSGEGDGAGRMDLL